MKIKVLALAISMLVPASVHPGEISNINEELQTANPEYIEKVYQLALMEYDKLAYEESLKYIRHVIRSDMFQYKLRYLAAHNHWKLGHFDLATAHLQVAIQAKPQNPEGYMDLALLKIQQRDYYSAERSIITGLSILQASKSNIPAKLYNIYSRIQLMKGLPVESLKYAELAKAAFAQGQTGIKDKLETITLEARSQLLLENYEKAELASQWAVAMKKDNVYAYNFLGYVYSKWHEKLSGLEPEKAKELKKLAIENFKLAKNTPHVIDEFKLIIESNIRNLK